MQKALADLPGVSHVEIDFPKKQALVTVKKDAPADDSRFIKAIEDIGGGFGGTIKDAGT